jgi:hypothetical protein
LRRRLDFLLLLRRGFFGFFLLLATGKDQSDSDEQCS